jgi:3-hydroxyacyl-CoA dehydrogenase
VRNRIVNGGLEAVARMKPAAFYLKEYIQPVETGNLEDDTARLRECDWVVEVVIENMEIKKKLFAEKVVPNLAAGAILSTNTSGLSVNEMAEALPAAVRKNFLVTHFFNPPRYMRLLEVVGCRETDPALLAPMADFLARRIGKGIVYAKGTPNFIANRTAHAIYKSIQHMVEWDDGGGGRRGGPRPPARRAPFSPPLVGTIPDARQQPGSCSPATKSGGLPRRHGEDGRAGCPATRAGRFYRKEKGENGNQTFYYDYNSASTSFGWPRFAPSRRSSRSMIPPAPEDGVEGPTGPSPGPTCATP